jgi:serine/threonine protein kinase
MVPVRSMNSEDEFATNLSPFDPSRKFPTQAEPSSDDTNGQTEDFRTSANDPDGTFDGPQDNTKHVGAVEIPTTKLPKKIGRYEIKKLLGRGGFGSVYLAQDEQLKRDVAIKLNLSSSASSQAVKMFLDEAQILAELDHPNIVSVYDVGTYEGDIYIVSKLVDGTDLAMRIKQNRPDLTLSLTLVAAIADALQFAHSKGLIHRDIKPANILLDKSERPYLADFGIALRESDYVGSMEMAGTPAYMSPEQARGEGHLMTHQSDIYSLGVVLYELLSGRRPFQAKSAYELLKLVKNTEVRTPRTYDASIPADLERICMKALARRPSERFAIAKDFADELRDFLAGRMDSQSARRGPSSARSTNVSTFQSDEQPSTKSADTQARIPRVVPKGLRSFDRSDSDFFLALLPGPFDRTGMPEGLRFWKNQIEAQQSFRVGLVSGPSGCGKSSLIKAGLLTRLSPKIASVYIEATQEDTSAKLLEEIQRRIPEVAGQSLSDALISIRRRKLLPHGGKLLLVIDQFEQWLYARKNFAQSELTDALRQCDGESIQAILMVRDDFWQSIGRFFKELDIPVVERENSAMVDLFDLDHAKKVLMLFGQAYNKLPDDFASCSQDQQKFIEQAIDELSQDDKVISVRLALFCEMMKSKPWTPNILAELGGISGVGVTFLEEMFGDRHVPIQYRQHQEGVRGLLGALLPAAGAIIKGHSRQLSELRKAAGYEERPKEFAELVNFLDKQLHLITPVDSKEEAQEETRRYQLTHDYLVPSLREWLTQKQKMTNRGRAELKLAERAAIWGANKEDKQLPTLLEWLQIRRWTQSSKWKDAERSVMEKAGRIHVRNLGIWLGGLSLLGAGISFVLHQQDVRAREKKTKEIVGFLGKVSGPVVPELIDILKKNNLPDLVVKELRANFDSNKTNDKISVAIGLSSFGEFERDYLVSQIDEISERSVEYFLRALGERKTESIQTLKKFAANCTLQKQQRRKARLALAALALGDFELPTEAAEFNQVANHGVRTWFIEEFSKWNLEVAGLIDSLSNCQSPALRSAVCLGFGQINKDRLSPEDRTLLQRLVDNWYLCTDSSTHSAVAWMIQELDLKEPKTVDVEINARGRDWFIDSQGSTFIKVKPADPNPIRNLIYSKEVELERLENDLIKQNAETQYRFTKSRLLYEIGSYEEATAQFDFLLQSQAKEPILEYQDPLPFYQLLSLARLKRTDRVNEMLGEWKAVARPDIYNAYITCLVPLWLGEITEAKEHFEGFLKKADSVDSNILEIYCRIAAQFSASENFSIDERKGWAETAISFLKKWNPNKDIDKARFVKNIVDYMPLHANPEFRDLVAEPPTASTKAFWISSHEVTRAQYNEFIQATKHHGIKTPYSNRPVGYSSENVSMNADLPAVNLNWYDALMYCNWLSLKDNRTPVYKSVGKIEVVTYDGKEKYEVDDWEIDETANGYRLPKEYEWRSACSAGALTPWSIGNSSELLHKYCQMYPETTSIKCGKKLPNALGVFDMHGNVNEWLWSDRSDASQTLVLGGSFFNDKEACRTEGGLSEYRIESRNSNGIRLVLDFPKND